MTDLPHPVTIDVPEESDCFGFYSPDLEGFRGIGHSVEDCIFKARHGMAEHVRLLRNQGTRVPETNPSPTIVEQNQQTPAPV